ncbi:MAG: MarR family transcriptional regulator [Proteobacteria bacterium]|nr:MAG: MarR family transcriptional regulator [Pseudomonadota bacterium]
MKDAREDLGTLLLDVIPLALRALRMDVQEGISETNFSCKQGESGLTFVQFRIMGYLWFDEANNKTLAEAVGLSVPAASRAVVALTKRGLVESTKASNDKREVRVRLSKSGRTMFKQARECLASRMSDRMSVASSEQSKRMQAGLIALKELFAGLT